MKIINKSDTRFSKKCDFRLPYFIYEDLVKFKNLLGFNSLTSALIYILSNELKNYYKVFKDYENK